MEDFYINFYKEFAEGKQNRKLSYRPNGEPSIVELDRNYYWQEDAVYNVVDSIINAYKDELKELAKRRSTTFEELTYGKDGFVAHIAPYQQAYNNAFNKYNEYLNRLTTGMLIVEDGSVDTDAIEDEGLCPGKILVYRHGANPPVLQTPDTTIVDILKDAIIFTYQRLALAAELFIDPIAED